VESSGGIQASLSGRYAAALFQLARDGQQIDVVGASLDTVAQALDASPDFRNLTTSPLIGAEASSRAIAAVAASLKLDTLTSNFLGVLAKNRRLSKLTAVIRDYRAMVSNHKGEARADVTSAHPLSATQVAALEKQLKARVGRDVAVTLKVDPEILGGLVVKIGSQMIDSSIRTRLNTLAQAMRG
jgi:F-type H+-transporting ATPase subunit delta